MIDVRSKPLTVGLFALSLIGPEAKQIEIA